VFNRFSNGSTCGAFQVLFSAARKLLHLDSGFLPLGRPRRKEAHPQQAHNPLLIVLRRMLGYYQTLNEEIAIFDERFRIS